MTTLGLFTGQPGLPEILVILVVILLLFGAKRLPELARSLGKSISEFKKGREEGDKPENSSKSESDEAEGGKK